MSVLVLEIALRMHFLRCQHFWCGTDWFWNYFDIVLAMTGVVDILVQLVHDEDFDIFGTSLLRFCRLIRLVRIVKAHAQSPLELCAIFTVFRATASSHLASVVNPTKQGAGCEANVTAQKIPEPRS